MKNSTRNVEGSAEKWVNMSKMWKR